MILQNFNGNDTAYADQYCSTTSFICSFAHTIYAKREKEYFHFIFLQTPKFMFNVSALDNYVVKYNNSIAEYQAANFNLLAGDDPISL